MVRLVDYLQFLSRKGITPLPEEEVRRQLAEGLPTAILTRDGVCGVRVSRVSPDEALVFVTNAFEERLDLLPPDRRICL